MRHTMLAAVIVSLGAATASRDEEEYPRLI